MVGIGRALAAAGYTVEVPRLPGHGTTVEDMLTTSWSDWSAHAEATLRDLSTRVSGPVVVIGLSMGGALTAWLATNYPALVRGIVLINAAVEPLDGIQPMIEAAIAEGTELFPAVGGDTKNGVQEIGAYDAAPLRPLLSMLGAIAAFDLAKIACPVLALTSSEDHVVPVTWFAHLAAKLPTPPRRVELTESFHVATIDNDASRCEIEIVTFANELFGISA